MSRITCNIVTFSNVANQVYLIWKKLYEYKYLEKLSCFKKCYPNGYLFPDSDLLTFIGDMMI